MTYLNKEPKKIDELELELNQAYIKINEQKQRIIELEEKGKRLHLYEMTLEQIPVSVLITDKNSNIIYVNKELAKNMGYEKNELIGQKPNIFKSGYTTDNEYKNLNKTIISGNTWNGLLNNSTKSKTNHWMATTIIPIFNIDNEISNYVSVETNIDEKLKMKQELKNQENIIINQARHAAMGEMISMIAHQWRQPLSLISTISSGLSMKSDLGILEPKIDFNDLKTIVKNTNYLSETIDNFKNFFKQNKLPVKTNAEDLINKLFDLNSKVFELDSINIKINNNSNIIINTYFNELLQVCINIINNSRNELNNRNILNKEIIITLNDKKNSLVIIINDNAGGIPDEIINKIFEPYFTTNGSKNGTGLGLYIVKTIVENNLEGFISVTNNNNGALFKIEIPCL